MNIKSLLLGSAAALVAVSGARAADAVVVAEPEPMDYVRVCDMYGAGFYYIPGTETCLAIGGYARYEIQFDDDDSGWRKLARAELIFSAKSETELGTLTGHIDLRGDVATPGAGFTSTSTSTTTYADTDLSGTVTAGDTWTTTTATSVSQRGDVRVQHVWIDLAGVRMGWSDTLYDAGIAGEFDSGGGDRVHFVRFVKSFGALTVGLSAEEDDNNFDYVPNVVAMVGGTFGPADVNAWAAYDATADEFALKAIASAKLGGAFSVNVIGTYESGTSFYSVSSGPATGYEFSLGASVAAAVGEKAKVTFGGQYFANQHATGADDFAIGVVLDYTIVENLAAKLAVNYRDGDSSADGSVDGFLRFTRSFGYQG